MKKLDGKAFWLFFFKDTPGFVIILPIVAFLLFQVTGGLLNTGPYADYLTTINVLLEGLIWIVIPLLLLFFVSWTWLSYNSYRYELTEKEFRSEFGVLRKRHVSIPYDQIQNVDIHRSIMDRLLGLSELHVQTAGAGEGLTGSKAEGVLPGLSKHEAEAVRNKLVNQAHIR